MTTSNNLLEQKNIKTAKFERVLYVWNYLDWGGAQIYFLALMKESKKKCDVKALIPEGSHPQLLKFLDSFEIPYEFVNAHRNSKPVFGIANKIKNHITKLRSEYIFCRALSKNDLENSVVHAEFAPWMSFAALYWLSKKTTVFTTVHNSVFPTLKWRHYIWKLKFGILAKQASFRIFTANEDAKKCLKEYVPQEFYDSITVTYASINPSEIKSAVADGFNANESKKKYNLPDNKFLIFCVGQFIDRKGRWIFLEAASNLLKKRNDTAFVWVSNSKPTGEDLRKIESYNLAENFTFINSEQVGKERSDLFRLINLADIFVLPSFVEGLPISLLEAMTLGKPVVSTNINGIPEAVKHLKTGVLINSGNAEELENAIINLLEDKSLRERLAQAGRDFVVEKFDERKVAKIAFEEYLKTFNECKKRKLE